MRTENIRYRLSLLIIMLVIFFISSPASAELEYLDIWKKNLVQLSQHIKWAPDICAYSKGDPSSEPLWVCMKKEHLLFGVDRKAMVIFNVWPIATGRKTGQKIKVGDMRTPEGNYSVQRIDNASYWPPYKDKKTGDTIGYGPWFIRLKTDPWKGIGIHGTDKLHSSEIGTNASHGCIRMHNEDLKRFKSLAKAGQRVIIIP